MVYETEEPVGFIIVKRSSPGLPVPCGRLLGLEVIVTHGQTNENFLKRLSMDSPTRVIHSFTLRIIGGVLVVVGIISLWRGETPILGVGILAGLLMLIAPSVFKK